MYQKLKYITLIILFIGIGFGFFSYFHFYEENYEVDFYIPMFLFGILIIFFLLPRDYKARSPILSISALLISVIFLLLSLDLTRTYFSHQRYEIIVKEYSSLSCEEMENRFVKDLENDELKYFSGGLIGTGNLENNLRKFDVENFDLGCIISGNFRCYSELVSAYLLEKEGVDVDDLWN